MKENKYDDDVFFNKYKEIDRFVQGLEGAGEWSRLKQLLPDFEGRHVLDLECGYDWHCVYVTQQKTTSVHGVDISEKMLAVAEEENRNYAITYQRSAMKDLQLSKAPFDVVISSLTFRYVKGLKQLAAAISTWLTPKGNFVPPVEHPVFIAYGTQDWYYAENGEILHFPVDNYYYEGKQEANFLRGRVVRYHRTLTIYLDTLLCNGFKLQRIVEPQPPGHVLDIEGMRGEMRRPMMPLIAVIKRWS